VIGVTLCPDGNWGTTPLYASPPKHKPLTDEQINRLADRMDNTHDSDLRKFAREVERAHGIGNE